MSTPDPCRIMWRAAARVVRNCVLIAFLIGRSKSSSAISASGVPCTSPSEMRLKEMSMAPAAAATALACSSTAASSKASRRGRLDTPPAGADRLRHSVEALRRSTGEMQARALAGEAAGHRASDRAARSIDDRGLALEQHVTPPEVRVSGIDPAKLPRSSRREGADDAVDQRPLGGLLGHAASRRVPACRVDQLEDD